MFLKFPRIGIIAICRRMQNIGAPEYNSQVKNVTFIFNFYFNQQQSLAYLGFHRGGGKFLMATSSYAKGGPNHVFLLSIW